jgi:carboxypeptidase C (cathepsin A)
MIRALALLAVTIALASSATGQPPRHAQPAEPAASSDPEAKAKGSVDGKDSKDKDKKPPEPVVTRHTVTIDGKAVSYTATAGYLQLPDYDGKPKADVFFVSYTVDAPQGGWKSARPITYAFNGGPGSSSVWLHLGALGPRRVRFADAGEKPGEPPLPLPPYGVVDNEFSWLDLTDLVFIDPVSTGYSRPVEGEKANQFHGLREDIQWVGDFIRLWTTRNKRWDSPKYLAGESYGTTRAAGLAGYLQDTHGMYLSGIVLVSPVLNFQTIEFDPGNDTAYWLFLPTYTATAWYHGRLEPDLQRDLEATLREVEDWAQTAYLVSLGKGDSLSGEEREQVVSRLSRYTGLSKDFVRGARMRIDQPHFVKELLREQGRTAGRLDSRYIGFDRSGVSDTPDYDPSYAAIQGPFTAALNHYVRSELNYENDRPYEILTGRVRPWSYASAQNRYAEVADTLREAMAKNPALRVLVCSGYYDLATPHFAAAYTIRQLGLPSESRDRIRQEFYRAGHMMYIRMDDLAKLKADVARLFGP